MIDYYVSIVMAVVMSISVIMVTTALALSEAIDFRY